MTDLPSIKPETHSIDPPGATAHGSSSSVCQFFRSFPIHVPEPTQISELVTLRLPLGAEAALVAIWERYGGSLP